MKKIYLECGKVLGAHGVRGVLKVESWCDTPRVLASQKRIFLAEGGEFVERRVLSASVTGPQVLMSIEGVYDRDEAISMKGVVMYLHRDDIPLRPGQMLLADMIGLPVTDAKTGVVLGKITEVTEVPRGLLYTIAPIRERCSIPPPTSLSRASIAREDCWLHLFPAFLTDMKFDILTLFPDMVSGVLSESIIGRAQAAGAISVECHNIRDYSTDKHRKTDDTPYGGGMGMVMTCQPIYDCYRHVRDRIPEGESVRVVYMSPKGALFNHTTALRLSEYDNLIILCGHYEGVDQRVLDEIVDEEISIGDYVLTGGEIPACIVVDAVSRLIPGVLPDSICYTDESVASGILEYPQYTKPRVFLGREVPEVLLSGDHKKIERYRLERAVELTRERRPDLLLLHPEYEQALLPKKKRSKRAHKDSTQRDDASASFESRTACDTDTQGDSEAE